MRLAVSQGMYSFSLLRNLVVLRARIVLTTFALKMIHTTDQLSVSGFINIICKSILSPCKVESIINNLSPVDHWNILKSELRNHVGGIRLPLLTGKNCSRVQVLYLVLRAQLGKEMLPVFRVVVDSVEAPHIYVGQQPLISTQRHVGVCSCMGGH